MKSAFYPKLAVSGIKKNGKTYVPYILTCIGCVMALYINMAMAFEPRWVEMPGGIMTPAFLSVGAVIISIFSLIFLFYTNSFLIKRRKKEFGLYNVLGMGKRHIAKTVFYETLFIALFSIAAGIALGVVFSKLTMLLMLKLIGVTTIFSMDFSVTAALGTAAVFGGIFVLNLLVTVIRIGKNKTIDLLYGGKMGEREPKSNIPMALIGVICLGGGYVMAQMVKDPMGALALFFAAVILVIIGTYATIMAGSTVILKLLRKNKRFYYKSNHFISVSGMLYRMKQNAAGIASICILFTMLLVTVSTTGCLYFGIDSMVGDRVNRDVMFTSVSNNPDKVAYYQKTLKTLQEDETLGVKDSYATTYRSFTVQETGDGYTLTHMYEGGTIDCIVLTEAEYEILAGSTLGLTENQVVIDNNGKQKEGELLFNGYAVEAVQSELPQLVRDAFLYNNNAATKNILMVVPGNDALTRLFVEEGAEFAAETRDNIQLFTNFVTGFNSANPDLAVEKFQALLDDGREETYFTPFTKQSMADELRNMLGSFLFLGAFLGILFLMATVLIMYYKQISEGYDDKQRFEIMEKVGMSQKEIRKTIKSQVLMVFFIPILFSIIHVGFAVKMIFLILMAFGMTSISVLIYYTVGSVALFAVLYLIAYAFTARSYYKIVK